jgi:GNAT superfamily N-acetyltransferase
MGMNTTRFREGGVEDTTVVFDCLKALATEEGHLTTFRLTETKLRDILSRQPNGVHVLLCENDRRLVGLAMWSERFSAYSGGAIMWLHDFYVVQASRREGIGQRLVNELRRIAQTQDYQRIEWYIHSDNDAARLFYKRVGGFKAEHIESWRLESM